MINLSSALHEDGRAEILPLLEIFGVELIPLHRISDSRGNLNYVDFKVLGNSSVKRIFCISNIPIGITRGNHAHKTCTQLLHSVVPNIILELDNSISTITVVMDTAEALLMIPPKIWLKFSASNSTSVLNVLATEFYDESDYIYKYEEFIEVVKKLND